MDDIADRYATRTACMPGRNVFLREDFHACTVGLLMIDD